MAGPHFHHLFKKIIHAVTLGCIISRVLTSLPFLGLLKLFSFYPFPLFMQPFPCKSRLSGSPASSPPLSSPRMSFLPSSHQLSPSGLREAMTQPPLDLESTANICAGFFLFSFLRRKAAQWEQTFRAGKHTKCRDHSGTSSPLWNFSCVPLQYLCVSSH